MAYGTIARILTLEQLRPQETDKIYKILEMNEYPNKKTKNLINKFNNKKTNNSDDKPNSTKE